MWILKKTYSKKYFLLVFLLSSRLDGLVEKFFLDLHNPKKNHLKYDCNGLNDLCMQGWFFIDTIRSVEISLEIKNNILNDFCILGLNIYSVALYLLNLKNIQLNEVFSKCSLQISSIKNNIEDIFSDANKSQNYLFCIALYDQILKLFLTQGCFKTRV